MITAAFGFLFLVAEAAVIFLVATRPQVIPAPQPEQGIPGENDPPTLVQWPLQPFARPGEPSYVRPYVAAILADPSDFTRQAS